MGRVLTFGLFALGLLVGVSATIMHFWLHRVTKRKKKNFSHLKIIKIQQMRGD